MKKENEIMAKIFVELSLEGKKETYEKSKHLLEFKTAFDKLFLKSLNEKEKELYLVQNEEKKLFNKVMEALIEWHEANEKVEEMAKEMGLGEENE